MFQNSLVLFMTEVLRLVQGPLRFPETITNLYGGRSSFYTSTKPMYCNRQDAKTDENTSILSSGTEDNVQTSRTKPLFPLYFFVLENI